MTVPQKSRKKKITIPVIPIVQNDEELYAEIYYSERDAVDNYHALL